VSAAQAVWLIARREIVERVRDRSFLISIVVVVLVLGAFVGLPRLFGFGDPDTYRVGVLPDAAPLADAVAAQAGEDAEVERRDLADMPAAEAALREDEVDVVLAGNELVVREELPDGLEALVQQAAAQLRVYEGFAERGVDADEVTALLNPEPLDVRSLDPAGGAGDRDAAAGFAFAIVFVLYGQLLGYGLAVASGIVEEKSTRVVEVLLSTVRPAHLLAGKVIGIGVVGLLQLLLTAGLALSLVVLTGTFTLPPDAAVAIAWSLAWFVLGYAFYACAFAIVGALVARQEELQNASTPLTLTVLAAFFLAIAANNDPGSVLARVGSFLPPTAPMVLPVRLTLGETAGWEVAVAVALMLLAIVALIALAARVYAAGALRVARRVKLRQALAST
jgi:ABC-2 type transport system permease protein